MTRTIVVRTASLPLIPPSHPLLMFSTDSEPCRMCTETSTRSTPLLPGRGSDYIWSINTHRLWEALCLSLLLPSLCLHLLFRLTPARFTTVWHLVTICQAICLCCHIFPTLNQRGGFLCVGGRSPTLHASVHSFMNCSRAVELFLHFSVRALCPPWWRKRVNYGVLGAAVLSDPFW